MINTAPLNKYLARVQDELDEPWIVEADNTIIGPFHTVGSIVKSFAISCFMGDKGVKYCVARIQASFPEKDDV